MPYRTRPTRRRRTQRVRFETPTKGMNTRDLPTGLHPQQAQYLENYLLGSDGRLKSRPGIQTLSLGLPGTEPLMLETWQDHSLVYAFYRAGETILERYHRETGEREVLHQSPGRRSVCGIGYGEYFFFCFEGDSIRWVHRTDAIMRLRTYSGGSLRTGAVLTGQETGTVMTITAIGQSDWVTCSVDPDSIDRHENFSISGSSGYARLAWGPVPHGELPGAPSAKVMGLYQHQNITNLVVGATHRSEGQVQWSAGDLQAGSIPFQDWHIASPPTPNDSGVMTYRPGGSVRSLSTLGERLVIGYDNGLVVIRLDVISIERVGQSQLVVTEYQREGDGMLCQAARLPEGLLYLNATGLGLMRIRSGGVSFSDLSASLSEDTWEQYDLPKTQITWDGGDLVLISLQRKDTSKREILAYSRRFKGLSWFTGVEAGRFARLGKTLYGLMEESGNITRVLEGEEDEGVPITTRLKTRAVHSPSGIDPFSLQRLWVRGALLEEVASLEIKVCTRERHGGENESSLQPWRGVDQTSLDQARDQTWYVRIPHIQEYSYELEGQGKHELHDITTELLSLPPLTPR